MPYPIPAFHFTSTCVPQMSVDCDPNRNCPPLLRLEPITIHKWLTLLQY